MSKKRSRKTRKPQAKLQELVVVAFAEDFDQAKDYETLLRNNDIPATIKEQVSEDTHTIAVMVPEDYIDEAHVVIESQDAYDDFYDFALDYDDQDDNNFDTDIFEDEF